MIDKTDYRIKKIEKGPLQRFKNRNLILKRFGEIGLQIYNAITGKRSVAELKRDLDIDSNLFDQTIEFMQSSGLVELEAEGPTSSEQELPPPEPELVSPPALTTKKKSASESVAPVGEIQPIDFDIPTSDVEKSEETYSSTGTSEMTNRKRMTKDSFEPKPPPSPEEPPAIDVSSPSEQEQQEIKYSSEDEFKSDSSGFGTPPAGAGSVEKIISDKYGQVGLKVYALIDGQRTAEEIMRETGLTEAKLVEILDFMDEQGIIKLDYPKSPPPPVAGKPGSFAQAYPPAAGASTSAYATAPPLPPTSQPSAEGGFSPMIEGDRAPDESGPVPSPLFIPAKAPLDLVRSVQLKAKLLIKYGDKVTKITDLLDGKNDALDIALKTGLPLYVILDILQEMMENGMLIKKEVPRAEVRKKYGDDGYSVYKRYGKEGLLLYELIGKEFSIKQMADKISKDRSKIVDMFIFIHQVLGIELPVDREMLLRQLDVLPASSSPPSGGKN